MELTNSDSAIDSNTKGHFLNLYAMALSDLSVDPEELKLLFSIGEQRGVPRGHIEDLLLNPDKVDFEAPEDTLTRAEYLYDLALMIWSDGVVDPAEKQLLEKLCLRFGFEAGNVAKIVSFFLEKAEVETPRNEVLDIVKKSL